jgi:LysR family transcriptional regulator of gallate degradation
MRIRHVEQFIRIYEHGSLGKAARFLNVSQPALTKTLHQIEADVGVPLFERTSRGITPTVFGECLYERVKRIESEIVHAMDDIDALRGTHTGHVTVGAIPVAVRRTLPRAIMQLLRKRPGVTVSVVEKPNSELLPELRKGRLDFVIAVLDDETETGLRRKRLYADELVVGVRAGHPLTKLAKPTPADLLLFPWISPRLATVRQRAISNYFRAAGLPTPRALINSASTAFVLSIMARSDFVTMLPDDVLETDENAKGLARIRLGSPLLRRSIGIVYGDPAGLTAASGALIDEIEKVCRSWRR